MRKRRLSSFLLAGVLMIASLTGCGSGSSGSSGSSQSAQDKTFSRNADENKGKDAMDNVKLLGRTYRADDGSLWMGLSGTGAELEFTGSKLSVTLKGSTDITDKTARVGVFVDGQLKNDICVGTAEQTVDIDGKGSEAVSVRIVKLSECSASCCAITAMDAHGGQIKKAADRHRRIEFIGDSITCGYGVDDPDLTHGFATATEDCTKSYAYKTAQALGADHSLVSYSGYGIVSGYTDSGVKNSSALVPTYYDYYGFTENGGFGSSDPSQLSWDHSAFTPDVVVVFLGTNDMSYTGYDEARCSEFTEGYASFLKQVRAKNAGAKIICTLGTMGDLLNGRMQDAVRQYSQQTGDSNITVLELPLQDMQADGVTINGHPSEKTYDKVTKLISDKIRSEMGWN